RVHTIGSAFESLRRAIPAYSSGQKLSKLAILRVASSYILALSSLVEDRPENFDEAVKACSSAIHLDGKFHFHVVIRDAREYDQEGNLRAGWSRSVSPLRAVVRRANVAFTVEQGRRRRRLGGHFLHRMRRANSLNDEDICSLPGAKICSSFAVEGKTCQLTDTLTPTHRRVATPGPNLAHVAITNIPKERTIEG
ncbi:hypothetical protein BIW11_04083, partial [Tropilaelaps mercedesae]